jgi:hypothetical protein
MKAVINKDLIKTKKPIQVYFEQDVIRSINQAALNKGVPVAEYIRETVILDLAKNQKTKKKHRYGTYDLGGELTNNEMDALIYKL